MGSLPNLFSLAHLIGLALGVGAATAKVVLLLKARSNPTSLPAYLEVARPITRQIIVGQVVLTLSGIGWLLLGYPFTPVLIVKLALVGAIWILGPFIDAVVEPKFRKLAPAAGGPASPEFVRIQNQYTALEVTATSIFYAIILLWVLR